MKNKINTSKEAAIAVTVDMWVEAIREGIQDMGDGFGNALRVFTNGLSSAATEEQLSKFKVELTNQLSNLIERYGCWNPDNPELGSALHELYTDYGADRALSAAAVASGVAAHHIPIKSCTKTCPGYVWYRFGYSAPWQKKEVLCDQE